MSTSYRRRSFTVAAIAALVLLWWAARGAAAPNQVFVDRGILDYDDKNYAAALAAFERAVELDPEDPNARYFLGLTLIALDRSEEAVTQLSRGLALAKDDLDIAFALGVALFNLSRYDEALRHFQAVFSREPQRENLGFYLGVIYYQTKDYERAIGALEGAVVSDPAFQQLRRFYAALANHQLGREVEASREMAQAESLRPSSPIAISARKFQDFITPPSPEVRSYRFELRAGYQYDDNVPIAPTRNVLSLRDARMASWGETLLARGAYDVLRGAWLTATVSFQLFSIFNDDLPRLDIRDYRPALEGVYRMAIGGRPLTAGLRYDYDLTEQNDAWLAWRNIVQPYVSYAWASWTDTTIVYRYEDNDSKVDPTLNLKEERLDSDSHDVGLIQGFYYGPAAFRVGYTLDTDQAAGRDHTFYGQKATAGVYANLPLGLVADVTFEYHDRDYPVGNKLARTLNGMGLTDSFRQKRHDGDQTLFLALSRAIPTPTGFPGTLVGSVEYFRERNVSTISLYDFERNTTSFNLIWRY
ncbi:MAG: hypothetical protein DMD82_04640 [Candidatus Rokuibacteriota bacterium]|nr:MAG: hypothetical protein DMD82_04640 [Candidatus Rokubacteria bacterium]